MPSVSQRKIAWLIFGSVLIIGLAWAGVVEKKGFNRPRARLGEIIEPNRFEENKLEGEGDNKIVLMRAEGLLYDMPVDGFGAEPGIVPLERLTRQLDQAQTDNQVKAVILLVNSPGGTVTASQTLAEKLVDFKKSGKKLIVLMREVAASGGYFISTPADKIIANSSTLTGSIGVIFQTANLEGLYQKIGYRPITFKAGRLKDIASPDRAITDEEKQIIQRLLDEDHELFKQLVVEGRQLAKEKVQAIADGRILSGRQAQELGLVDELGNLPKAIEVAKKESGLEKAKIVEYVTPLGFLGDFLGFDFFMPAGLAKIINQLDGRSTVHSGLMYLWVPWLTQNSKVKTQNYK